MAKGMITNIKVVPHETQPGREVECRSFSVPNYRLHHICYAIARACVAAVDSENNNTSAAVNPRGIAQMIAGFQVAKQHFGDITDNRNAPAPIMEFDHVIYLPTGREIMRMKNYKLQVVVKEMKFLAEIIIDSDSAKLNGHVDEVCYKKIQEAMDACEKTIVKYIGTGKDHTDVGMNIPGFLHMGELVPDLDGDQQGVREPSPDAPVSGRPDVPDLPVSNGD